MDNEKYVAEYISNYDEIFEMANYETRDSGLPFDIWFDEIKADRKGKHSSPRVKIAVDGELIPISISTDPAFLAKGSHLRRHEDALSGKDRRRMFTFISKNHDVIIAHWNGELTTFGMMSKLKR